MRITIENLKKCMAESSWQEIVESTSDLEEADSDASSSYYFFRANAFLKLGKYGDAERVVERGMLLDPNSEWGSQLAFSCRLSAGQSELAFMEYKKFLGSMEKNSDRFKPVLVDQAVKHGKYDLAVDINETREVIANKDAKSRFAVALQCFNKPDTLEEALQSLIGCNGVESFDLVILQDSPIGSKKEAEYSEGCKAVSDILGKWLPELLSIFKCVEILKNRSNRGTAPSCRKLLDYAISGRDGFLFIEDDCLLSPDALLWSQYHLDNTVSPYGYWFATCESIYFNSGKIGPPGEEIIKASESYVDRAGLESYFVEINFVPSTCFVTTSEVWRMARGLRSLVRGPESLNAYMREFGAKSICPVVPRAKDVGMLHASGYSVAMLGKDNVKEHKYTYLMSSRADVPENVALYKGDIDLLYDASVGLVHDSWLKLKVAA